MSGTQKLVRIDWIDSAVAQAGWTTMDAIMKDTEPCHCQSVGWVIHEDDVSITLAPHVGHGSKHAIPEQASGVMTIPKCAVKGVTTLPDGGPVVSPVLKATRKVIADKTTSKRARVAAGRDITQRK